MTQADIITITGIVITAIASIIAAYFSYKDSHQIHEVHLQLNSRLDAFIKAAESEARTKGAADAREIDKRLRADDSAKTTEPRWPYHDPNLLDE